MATKLDFHGRGPITYKSATNKKANILHQLGYPLAATKLWREIWRQRKEIEALTKHHLGLGTEYTCTVLNPSTWIQGSFNICIPIEAKSDLLHRKLSFAAPCRTSLRKTYILVQ